MSWWRSSSPSTWGTWRWRTKNWSCWWGSRRPCLCRSTVFPVRALYWSEWGFSRASGLCPCWLWGTTVWSRPGAGWGTSWGTGWHSTTTFGGGFVPAVQFSGGRSVWAVWWASAARSSPFRLETVWLQPNIFSWGSIRRLFSHYLCVPSTETPACPSGFSSSRSSSRSKISGPARRRKGRILRWPPRALRTLTNYSRCKRHVTLGVTVICRVVVRGAVEVRLGKVRHQTFNRALVYAPSVSDRVKMIEHLENWGAGLVNGAHDGLPFGGQLLQQHDALLRGGTVQAAGRCRDVHVKKG